MKIELLKNRLRKLESRGNTYENCGVMRKIRRQLKKEEDNK